jgi:hypothetical protein
MVRLVPVPDAAAATPRAGHRAARAAKRSRKDARAAGLVVEADRDAGRADAGREAARREQAEESVRALREAARAAM